MMSAGVIALTLGGVGCPADETPVDAGSDPVDGGVDAADGPLDAARDVTPPPDDAMRDAGSDGTTMSDLGRDARPMDGDMAPDSVAPDMDPPMIDVGPPCADDEACAGGICDDGRCRPCMGDGECVSGLCDEGACRPCADDGECPTGVCEAGVCAPCERDAQCATGLCDEGACRPCAQNADCGERVCDQGACRACAADGECDSGLCIGGACRPCAAGDECVSGLCEDGACVPCARDAECPGICEDEVCAPCLDDARCPGICRDEACAPCEGDEQCPGVCREGACLPCAENAECGEDVCVGGVCRPCARDEECGEGQACFADGRCGPATVIDAMRAEPDLANMLEVIELAESIDDLRERRTVTFFAPTDATLRRLSPLCIAIIANDWQRFVRHHTLSDPVAPDLEQIRLEVANAGGELALVMESIESTVLTQSEDAIQIDGSPIVRSLRAGNGRVHVIEDWVLLTNALSSPDTGCSPPDP